MTGITATPAASQIVTRTFPTFYFIGVTTGKSSIMKVFPLWMKELGTPEIVIEGIDHPMHDQPENYRRSVAQIKYDPLSLGALVTTHKINLLDAARDMFDYLDPNAQICGEISSISKLEGRLEGHPGRPRPRRVLDSGSPRLLRRDGRWGDPPRRGSPHRHAGGLEGIRPWALRARGGDDGLPRQGGLAPSEIAPSQTI